jgi:hypothetical protein
LTERQYNFLVTESIRTGLPMAELVRRAINTTYRPGLVPLVRGYEFTVGLFRRPSTATIGRGGLRRLFDG